MNNKVILFLNGEIPNQIPDLTTYQKIFCTDGSYNYLKKIGIQPDVICGDFDSINTTEFPSESEIIHTPDQNFTDFEKALHLIWQKKYLNVDVFGASGKQQDHFLGNLNAAYKMKEKLNIKFFDNYSCYYFLNKSNTIKNVINKTISLYPFPIAKGIETEGLMYPLQREDLSLLERIGTRNKAILNEIKITYTTGDLILFIIN